MPEKSDIISYKFPKENKLCLKRDVDRLFKEGDSFISYPLRVVYLVCEKSDYKDKVLVVVGKKYHKRANKRNRIKRLIRENYRIQRHTLIQDLDLKATDAIHIAFMCVSNSLPSFHEIKEAMSKSIKKIIGQINKPNQ